MELLKSVAKGSRIQLDKDVIALYEFATFGFIVSRRTIFRNVKRLLCDEYITIKPASERFIEFEVKKYWEPSAGIIDNRNVGLLIKKLVRQLNLFCKEAGGSKIIVPISGGIDSTLLLFLAKRAANCKNLFPVHLNFENRREQLLSKYVSMKAGLPYTSYVFPISRLKEEYLQNLSKLLRLIGYPREGDASLPYLIMAQNIKERRFSLGGDDADTLFGGYDYYKYFGAQLISERRFKEFLQLMRTLKKYNYGQEKYVLLSN